MRTVVLAYHEIGAAALRQAIASGLQVVAVFTHRDDPKEGGWYASVARLAAEHGIPVHAPARIDHPIWVERIRALQPELLLSFHYRNMVGPAVRALFPKGCINLHSALLPKYRGRCPINWVLVHGERETGVTLHHMVDKADAGDIIAQRSIAIGPDETAWELTQRICTESAQLLAETIPLLVAGTAPRRAQDESQATVMGPRTPADGEIDWTRSTEQICNLVRAVSHPWPGAFTFAGTRKLMVWKVRRVQTPAGAAAAPGELVSAAPLIVAAGDGALEIVEAQGPDGVWTTGPQLATEMNLRPRMRLGKRASARRRRCTSVLILGVNGFIGSHVSERLLRDDGFEVYGMDLNSENLGALTEHPRFHFLEGDISINREWVEYHVRKCDVVLPLVAIATPIEYVRNPLRVFELDFEENLRVVRDVVRYNKRLVFPSTSEVYGMCTDELFDEETSPLVTGPIHRQRWIYSASKQLLDRVIWAYGAQRGLRFSLFRPFNWIGPRLDSLDSARIGSSRAITQLILNLVEGTPILLVDGGAQRRCFTDVDEGIECLYRIIANEQSACDGRIFNVGNPDNEASIRELAEMLVNAFDRHPLRSLYPPFAGFQQIESASYYGQGYEDVQHRRPSIRNARTLIDWTPRIATAASVERTLDWFLQQHARENGLLRQGSGGAKEAPRRGGTTVRA
ncbi:MAG: bifunctional UDP-4-amino-4-deoxy-L-arabinose formyltransferase/UDP-glucuronic acid oxidase ArnA [Planctomycetes bacterium]|nr:bifunctional UDP-4-amino-4-deoxy-L-arabinose formyltransferase/UDP-glucuronic acid oxidase ArnA [Planctomycetota bacterium]